MLESGGGTTLAPTSCVRSLDSLKVPNLVFSMRGWAYSEPSDESSSAVGMPVVWNAAGAARQHTDAVRLRWRAHSNCAVRARCLEGVFEHVRAGSSHMDDGGGQWGAPLGPLVHMAPGLLRVTYAALSGLVW